MIVTSGLTKVFDKKHRSRRLSLGKPHRHRLGRKELVMAVDKVDLEISPGTVFGLLGPNGAGKTTLIKLLSTLIIPSSGSAIVNGYDIRTQEKRVRASIGLGLGGERSFYWRLTGRQNLEFFGTMQGLTGKKLEERIEEVMVKLDLIEVQDTPFMEYSSGMKRKLDIARALLTDPPIFLFDELTSSIDPAAAVKIRELIQQLKEQGKTILLVTHNLVEAKQLCDIIGIMKHGRLIAVGSVSSLRGLIKGCKIRIRLDGRGDDLLHVLMGLDGVENLRRCAVPELAFLTLPCSYAIISPPYSQSAGEGEAIIRVVVIEDCPPTLEGLRVILAREADITVVGRAGSGEEEIATAQRPQTEEFRLEVGESFAPYLIITQPALTIVLPQIPI